MNALQLIIIKGNESYLFFFIKNKNAYIYIKK